MEIDALAIVRELEDSPEHSLPRPRSTWNVDLARSQFPICKKCRRVPPLIKNVVALIEASMQRAPEIGARGILAEYLGCEESQGVCSTLLEEAFRAPEVLEVVAGRNASKRLAGVPINQLLAESIDTLLLGALGWESWSIWTSVDFKERLRSPHRQLSRELQRALRDTTSIRKVLKDLEQSFVQADMLLDWVGSLDNEHRIESLINRELCARAKDGHTGVAVGALLRRLEPNPGLNSAGLRRRLRTLVQRNRLVATGSLDTDSTLVGTAFLGRADREAAAFIRKRLKRKTPQFGVTLEGDELTREQANAVQTSLSEPICLITGGAGTGKSYTIRALVKAAPLQRWLVLSPTWKALAAIKGALKGVVCAELRLMTVARFNIITCGRLPDGSRVLDFRYERFGDEFNIVVDEVGFLDSRSFRYLMSGAQHCRHLTLVGDPQQLASVGPGSVLRDLCEAPGIPHAHLTKQLRSRDELGINTLSRELAGGRLSLLGNGVHHIDDVIEIQDIAVRRYSELQWGVRSPLDLQVIAPFNWLCERVNDILHKANRKNRVCKHLKVGDPVIAAENILPTMLKGEMGYVCRGLGDEEAIEIALANGDVRVVSSSHVSGLQVAYCITVHKSQGSQWEHVIVALPNADILVDRAMLYTAVTRARESVTLIAWGSSLRAWVGKCASVERETLLREFLLGDELA